VKTAVIGNSHVLAIQSALAGKPTTSAGVDCYFMPGHWEIAAGTAADGEARNVLVNAPTLGASDGGIDLERYDRFVVSAMGWWAARNVVVEGTPTHPLGYMACADWPVDPARVASSVVTVSHQVFSVTLQEWIRDHPVMRLARHVSEHYRSRPVLLQPWPAPNRALRADPDWFVNRWYGDAGPRAWHDYFLAQHEAIRHLADEMAPNVTLLDYPLPGPRADGFMAGHWCDPDPFHANEDYGELVVRQIESS
jgi:hypothetical protein